MRTELLFLVCAGLSSCLGYSIEPCDDNNKVQMEETSDAVLTCTDITHNDMVWRINHTDGTVSQIGDCSWPSGTCSVTDMDSDYSLSRPEKARSVLTVTDNLRTKIAGEVQCAGLNGSSTQGTATCDVRVVYTSYEVTHCAVRVTTSTSPWTVSGSCALDKIFASDNQYSCQWFQIHVEVGPSNFDGQMIVTSFQDSSEKEYQRATCLFSGKSIPVDGQWRYLVKINPRKHEEAIPAKVIDIQSPTDPPVLVNCTQHVIVGDDGSCTCQASPAEPSALVTWSGNSADSSIETLSLNNVPESLDGQNYTCSQYWGGFSTIHERETVYTLNVKYPPSSLPQIRGNTSYTEGDSLVLTCAVTGGNPPVSSVTFYCESHGDNVDSFSTQDGQTEVISTIEINSLTTRDNGTLCLGYANWHLRPSLYQTTSTVTIVVQAETTTAPTTSSSDGDGGKMGGNDDDSVAYIAGGVSAAVIVIIIVVVIIVVVRKKRKGKPLNEDSRTKDDGDEEEFEEHVNVMYESTDDVSPGCTKPSAVAFRIPAAENSSGPRQHPGSEEQIDQNYSTIPSQYFQSSAQLNGGVTDQDPNRRLHSASSVRPENIPDPDMEMDGTYSSADMVYDHSDPNLDTDLYSSADAETIDPVVDVPEHAPPEDAGAYAVINKSNSQKKPLDPQNNDYAVVNKTRTSSRLNSDPAHTPDTDSSPGQYIYAEVNKKSKGSNSGSAAGRPPEEEAEQSAQVWKSKPVPAVKPKPTVAAKPSVPAKPLPAGISNSNQNPGQGRPSVTSDYEEVDLPNQEEATVTTEDDYNTLAFHRRPSIEQPEDPESQYSHIMAV